eukprot:gene25813-32308_t
MKWQMARRAEKMNPSVIREILKVTEKPGIISFAGGLPSPKTFPIDAMREASERVLRDDGKAALQYAASEGYAPLREWVAQDLLKQGMNVSPDQVLITTGSQQGLDLVAKILIDAGSRILVETPTYLGALQAFTPMEPVAVGVNSDEHGVDPDDLRAKVGTGADKARFVYLLPNFQNPTGRTMTEARRAERHAQRAAARTAGPQQALPRAFLYSGFLIFLVPVLLSGLGLSKSEIGRYTMLYGLSSLALAPLFAHLADRYNAYAPLVAAGGLLTGLGLLPVAWGASGGLVMLGIGALGVGQSMSISAQLVLVARVTRKEAQHAGNGPIVGLFRLLERLGAAAGPVVTGMLAARYGAAQAMACLGVFALVASLLFSLVFAVAGARDRRTGKQDGGVPQVAA